MPEFFAKRVAFSPSEFAALFGKSQTWGYRQIYAGKVKTVTEYGRIMIPAKEVERVLESAGIYNGKEKPVAVNKRLAKLPEKTRGVWERFLAARRQSQVNSTPSKSHGKVPGPKTRKQSSASRRFPKSWSSKQSMLSGGK